jgi:hypothetical protein
MIQAKMFVVPEILIKTLNFYFFKLSPLEHLENENPLL